MRKGKDPEPDPVLDLDPQHWLRLSIEGSELSSDYSDEDLKGQQWYEHGDMRVRNLRDNPVPDVYGSWQNGIS
jgi:hypothetical protein